MIVMGRLIAIAPIDPIINHPMYELIGGSVYSECNQEWHTRKHMDVYQSEGSSLEPKKSAFHFPFLGRNHWV